MTTAAGCLAALMVEVCWRADRGLVTTSEAVQLVRDDIADAAMHGDQDRLNVLWVSLDRLLAEASTFYAQRAI